MPWKRHLGPMWSHKAVGLYLGEALLGPFEKVHVIMEGPKSM